MNHFGGGHTRAALHDNGDLYFDRTECRRHGGISTAPHDALNANVGKLMATNKLSLGEATDIIAYRYLACYHTARCSEAQICFPRSIPYIRAAGASCRVSNTALHLRCSDKAINVKAVVK